MSYTFDYGTQAAYDPYSQAGAGPSQDYASGDVYGAINDGYGAAAGYADVEEAEVITQEDCWTVIASYFADKTLVSQQIDSFNEFVNNTMQELVDEGGALILDQNMQHSGKAGDVTVRFSSFLLRFPFFCSVSVERW